MKLKEKRMQKSNNQINKEAWESYKKSKDITYAEQEEQLFGEVTQEQFEKLRFKISNQSLRLAACINHPQGVQFGFRLHPPHLWKIEEGKLFKKINGEWKRFIPNIADNLSRL